jgi:hypothetical protein
VLYVISVHYGSPEWIEIQSERLRRHLSVPYQTWTSLEGIDPAYGSHFDRVFPQRGRHPGKLNHLALEISHEAADEDLLMFLDGDAFPIADPMPLVEEGLAKAPLVAVRRAENVDQPQPHPCFCVTSVGTWRRLPGDWSGGPAWRGARETLVTDVGGSLLRALELSGTPWVQVLRTNRTNLDPLYFGIYGDVIYHHGAGFRTGQLSGTHSHTGPQGLEWRGPLRPLSRALNRSRWVRWERAERRRHVEQSKLVHAKIARGGDEWLAELR